MVFDRFDICEAYYMFAVLWHASGQCMHPKSGREIFSRLHRMKFKPAPSLTEETLNENARAIFDELERLEHLGSKTPVPPWVKYLKAPHASIQK